MYRVFLRYIAAIFVLFVSSYFIFDQSITEALKFTILIGIIFILFEFLDRQKKEKN